MVPLSDESTLAEAREYLKNNYEGGTHCPCCYQSVKLYKRRVNSGMARTLINMYREGGGKDFIDVFKKGCRVSTDFPIMRFFGIIESDGKNREDGSSRTGMWRITPHGLTYLFGQAKTRKYVWTYNNKSWRSSEEMASIHDALGSKFNYDKLMNGTL